jgi:hypothetical protein
MPRLLSVSWNTRKTICSVMTVDATKLKLSLERLGTVIGESESIDGEGKGRVIFEEVDDLVGEQIILLLHRDGVKVVEERMNFGETWNAA